MNDERPREASPVRVFIADDHSIVRMGLRHLCEELGGFEVVGEACNGSELLRDPALTRAQVLILDLSLPVISGMEALGRLRQSRPGLAVVVHSMHPPGQFELRSREAGAFAYVAKDRPPAELIAAIEAAARGESWPAGSATGPEQPANERAPHLDFSPRQHQVFTLLLEGRSVAEIAAELDLHSSTVSNHLATVRRKLGVESVADMVRYALSHGVIEAPPT